MNKDNCYYGWIPILTKNLLFGYFIKELEKEKKIVEGEEKKKLDDILSKTNGRYYIHETHEDVKDEKFKVIISVDDNKIDHIFIFKHLNSTLCDKNIAAKASCNIENNGLVKLKVESTELKDWEEHEIIKQVYIIIRDVYHHHTHHDPQAEILLRPVTAKDKNDAIEQIVNQFQEKIITYHTLIRKDIKNENDFDDASNLVVKAKGEMVYASTFIDLFKGDLNELQSYFSVFSNAFKSIDVLASDIESVYTLRLTRIITGLTIGILVLTAPIAIDATFKSLKDILGIEHLTFTTHIIIVLVYLVYLSILLIAIYKLREWIKRGLKPKFDRFNSFLEAPV